MIKLKLVTNPYASPESRGRKGVIVEGEWDASAEAFIHENDVKALYLNSSKGWIGTEYGFLRRLKSIEELNIIAPRSSGLEGVEEMESLEELSLATNTTSQIDFSKVSRLKKCFLDWWRGAEAIFSCATLEDLHLYGAKLPSFEAIAGMASLRAITLASSNIGDLKPIVSLSELKRVQLLDCRKVTAYDTLASLNELRWLRVEGVRDLGAIDFISTLTQLEVLQLNGVGGIHSLKPLQPLRNLRAFSFADNTNVIDGDLAVLGQLPQLAMLMFAPRKHYSHKLVKPWSWKNFDYPDKLLTEK